MKYVPPSVRETAFNCPHCGALANQFWYSLRADQQAHKHPKLTIFYEGHEGDWDFSQVEDPELRQTMLDWAHKMKSGRPFSNMARTAITVLKPCIMCTFRAVSTATTSPSGFTII